MKISQNNKILVCDLSKKIQNRLFDFTQTILKDFLYEYLPINYPYTKINENKVLVNYDLIYKNNPLMKNINSFNILAISTNDLEQTNFIKLLLDYKVCFKQSLIIFYDYINNNQNHKKIINFLKIVKNTNYIILENIDINLLPNSLLYWKIVSLL